MTTNDWVKCPTYWIRENKLTELSNQDLLGSSSAIMCYVALCHVADRNNGVAKATYDDLQKVLDMSRSAISKGLSKLKAMSLICGDNNQSTYNLLCPDFSKGWGKLPMKTMYSKTGTISLFSACNFRKKVELDALKMFLLIVAFRDEATNQALISYDKIEERTGILRRNIPQAISFLHGYNLITTIQNVNSSGNYSHAYRLNSIYPYKHQSSIGRKN